MSDKAQYFFRFPRRFHLNFAVMLNALCRSLKLPPTAKQVIEKQLVFLCLLRPQNWPCMGESDTAIPLVLLLSEASFPWLRTTI
jgi:hypothetical protein